jgi:natural product biosynthesis luciferase-like monooxygenase protein
MTDHSPSPTAIPWRCAFIGDESLAAQCAEIARQHGLTVVVMATTNAQVREYAAESGIACIDSAGDLATTLAEHDFDVLLSVANLRVLPDEVLALAPVNINFHDGPLPGYAGLNVTTHAILGGETTHEITWHVMTSDVDGGEVIAAEPMPILADDTAFSLNARCYEAGVRSFTRVAEQLAAGRLQTTPQPAGEHRMFGKFTRPAAVFDPAAPAAATDRLRRALSLGVRYRNTLGSLRIVLGDDVYVVEKTAVVDATPGAAPGTIVSIDDAGVRIATADADLVLAEVSTPAGAFTCAREMVTARGLAAGDTFPSPPAELVAALDAADPQLARSETFWLKRLAGHEPTDVPRVSLTPAGTSWSSRAVDIPAHATADVLTAIAAWLARVSGTSRAAVAYHDAGTRAAAAALRPLVHRPVATVDLTPGMSFAALRAAVVAERATLAKRGPFLADLLGRDPRTREHVPVIPVVVDLDAPAGNDTAAHPADLPAGAVLHLVVGTDGGATTLTLRHRNDAIDAAHATRTAEQLATVLTAGLAAPDTDANTLPLVGPDEQTILDAINATVVAYDRDATVDELFRAQARRTPSAKALSFGSRTLTYAELREAANALSAKLRNAGVGRGDRVGIALPRGIDMVVSVLATLDCGAAYLPLDPTYPDDRLDFMVDDAGIKALIAEGEIAVRLSRPGLALVHPNDAAVELDAAAHDHVATDLAYVIYTSGSTGKPKGVMLTHRNANNFFVAMDEKIEHRTPGVWLSVTSLSFDISVLELLWTLTRGYHVVLKADRGIPTHGAASSGIAATPANTSKPMGTRPVSMSLYYFAAGESEAAEGYRLLLEGARFADANGFEAVWTPERHFHAFGGLYPNPAVVSAAIASHTEHVKIRSGSVVLPLHSPARVAEEWAVVDNLSHGRVGMSFAAGWQPNDFVLNPSKYGSAKTELPGMIDTVRRLWRGETVEFPGHDGNPVHIRTLPRPVQPELECWLTSAGSTSTFVQAGELGYNLLTHLLGQSVDQLASNIAKYREAWQKAGHPGEGKVTLMLHTFIDTDTARAKEAARLPLKGYLNTAAGLLKDMASAFPTFAGSGKDADEAFKSLTEDEVGQLLDMATARYLETSGLFGTPHEAAHMIEKVSAVGVDEVACLIDFGIETQKVLDSFGLLLETKAIVDTHRKAAASAPAPTDVEVIDVADDTVAALTAKHGVTHLQCTPSLAAMLVADPADREALRSIQHMMVGGEALPAALATELRELLPARFTNMYGPTETTIWSLTYEIDKAPEGNVPIGLPIANTTIFVLDANGQPLPMGAFGELHIGGDGVARGYHNRPELTAERFVDRPGMGLVYATGDVARIHPSGTVEFAGRADNQVKIRGHRIELGEIEAVLDTHPDVVQSVVVARSDSGTPQLVAYVVTHGNRKADSDILRKHVAEELPEIMVPAVVVTLPGFPLTPNGKVDRKALPAPPAGAGVVSATANVVPPADEHETLVAQIWTEELGRPVSRDDNFFEIGGHSLLAVKVFRRLTDASDVPLALTDIFRYPTIRTFAAHLRAAAGEPAGAPAGGGTAPGATGAGTPAPVAPSAVDRGAMRRRAMNRRGGD